MCSLAVRGSPRGEPCIKVLSAVFAAPPPYKPPAMLHFSSTTISLPSLATARASVLHLFGCISSRKTWAPSVVRLATLFARPCAYRVPYLDRFLNHIFSILHFKPFIFPLNLVFLLHIQFRHILDSAYLSRSQLAPTPPHHRAEAPRLPPRTPPTPLRA